MGRGPVNTSIIYRYQRLELQLRWNWRQCHQLIWQDAGTAAVIGCHMCINPSVQMYASTVYSLQGCTRREDPQEEAKIRLQKAATDHEYVEDYHSTGSQHNQKNSHSSVIVA